MTTNSQVKQDPAAAKNTLAVPRIALVGVHGYGARHLLNLRRLEDEGALQLVAVADPNPPLPGELRESVAVYSTVDQLLAAGTAPDVVIIATPIQTHAPIALAAIAAGADVYLEKPAAGSFADYQRIADAAAAADRAVQVGFQSLGSEALPAITAAVAGGSIGRVRGISATGLWVRNRAYYKRSRWAGKRTLDGVDVVDGVATNPLAHAVATALCIAGARGAGDVDTVETDLYRAHDIEGDDTSVVRIRTAAGSTVLCALTLCAAEQSEPFVTIHGTEGQMTFFYTTDVLETGTGAEAQRTSYGRSDLLENLLAHRSAGTALLSSLADSGAFMRVLEAIRTAEAPAAVDPAYVEWLGEDDEAHPVIWNVEDLILRATKAQATFRELAAPWARDLAATDEFRVAGRTMARYLSGSHVAPTSSPRPYLHPVSTLAGTVVTDHAPADHVWHLGAGVAVQDVNEVNFWGGRTYRREAAGYVWREDHGRIRRVSSTGSADSLAEVLEWTGPDGSALLTEHRSWSWRGVNATTWQLDLEFRLSPAGPDPVLLGSPGSNGRPQGGYGGFFWRLPACTDADVRTAYASGEDAVHGTVAPWLAWSAGFDGAPATLVFLAGPGYPDPWFVRQSGYPGVGLSLAWETPVTATADHPVHRTVTVLIADGTMTDDAIDTLARNLQEK